MKECSENCLLVDPSHRFGNMPEWVDQNDLDSAETRLEDHQEATRKDLYDSRILASGHSERCQDCYRLTLDLGKWCQHQQRILGILLKT